MLISVKNNQILHHILLVDNYDSFTYNLSHYLEGINCRVDVVRNNEVVKEKLLAYDSIILSPGPGLPKEHTNLMEIIRLCDGKLPILGVCLGMQAIALHLGAKLKNKKVVMHGVEEMITIVNHTGIFQGLPAKLNVGLYHSWRVEKSHNFNCDAFSISDNTLMAMSQPSRGLYGIQFHPESIMTECGLDILRNFLKIKKGNL